MARSKTEVLRPAPTAAAHLRRPKRSQVLTHAFEIAHTIQPEDIERFTPEPLHASVAEAILAGATTITKIDAFLGVTDRTTSRVLRDPLAMAWISQQIERHFRHRVGLVDAALFTRAVEGDVSAIRLFFERYGKLQDRRTVEYTGSVDVRHLSDADLARVVRDKSQQLPVPVDVAFESRSPVLGPTGTGAPVPPRALTVLQDTVSPPQETTDLPRPGQDLSPPPDVGRQQVGQNVCGHP